MKEKKDGCAGSGAGGSADSGVEDCGIGDGVEDGGISGAVKAGGISGGVEASGTENGVENSGNYDDTGKNAGDNGCANCRKHQNYHHRAGGR